LQRPQTANPGKLIEPRLRAFWKMRVYKYQSQLGAGGRQAGQAWKEGWCSGLLSLWFDFALVRSPGMGTTSVLISLDTRSQE
jgi:hypothetical protein